MNIKIIGAGSAGNHICFAFRKIGAKVTLTDASNESLLRTKNIIYKKRYGKWDNSIKLLKEKNDFSKYDLIIISTPPSTHINLLNKNINNSNNFLIEKPVCAPTYKNIKTLNKIIKNNRKKNFYCGYNHRLFPSTNFFKKIVNLNYKKINFINVNFKENTSGFLNAHFWFKSLNDSYLSKTKEGGGALCEHSHALNLAQYLLKDSKKIKIISKKLVFKKIKKSYYDKSVDLFLTEKNKLIQVVQNFETQPTEKSVVASGNNFFAKLIYNFDKSNDKIIYINKNKIKHKIFKKKRSDDFLYEANHIKKIIKQKNNSSVINIQSAIQTMNLIVSTLEKK